MQEPQTLALRFVNAGAGPDGADPLRSPKETARWLHDALAHGGPHGLDADPTITILHRDALALRRSLRALLTAHRDGAPPREQDLWLMNACLTESSTVTRVRVTTEGSLTIDTTHVPLGPRASLGVAPAGGFDGHGEFTPRPSDQSPPVSPPAAALAAAATSRSDPNDPE